MSIMMFLHQRILRLSRLLPFLLVLLGCWPFTTLLQHQRVLLLPLVAAASTTETLIGITGRDFVVLAADTGPGSGGSLARTTRFVDKIHVLDDEGSAPLLVATAGDAADADRLMGQLRTARSRAVYEDQASLAGLGGGHAVTFVDCGTSSSSSETGGMPAIVPPRISRNNEGLSVDCVAEAARYIVWQRLRSRRQPRLQVSMLLAGISSVDDDSPHQQHQHSQSTKDVGVVQRQVTLATSSLLLKTTTEAGKADQTIDKAPSLLIQPSVAASFSSVGQQQQHQPALFWLDEYGALQRLLYAVHGGPSSALLWSVLDRGYRPNLSVDEAVTLVRECLQQLQTRSMVSTSQFCVKCLDTASGTCRVISLDEDSTAEVAPGG